MQKNEENKYLYQDVVISWFPFLVCFIVIPFAIYIPNQNEFEYNLWTLAPVFICSVAFLFALAGLRYLPPELRSRLAKGLFFLGAFLLLSDIVAPLQWGIFDGQETLEEPLGLTLIEFILAIGTLVCYRVLSTRLVRRLGTTMVIAFFAVQMVYLFIGITGRDSEKKNTEEVRNTDRNRVPVSKQGNVYHIVFDAYSNGLFMDSVKRRGLCSDFNGFTFFEKNLSNYVVTDASVPSFLTGSFYKEGSFNTWQRQAKSGGLRRQLLKAGYDISLYIPNRSRYWAFDNAAHIRTSRDIAKSYYVPGADQILLIQISLVRVTPNFLRKEVNSLFHEAYVKILRRFGYKAWKDYKHYKSLSVPLFQQFLQEEAHRGNSGNYIYMHLILPHSPFNWNCHCEQSPDPTSFMDQTDCSTLLMSKLIRTLKQTGKFQASTIIFQSDHGFHGVEGGDPKTGIQPPKDVFEKITSNAKYFTPEGFFRRVHSLLVIKPPFAASQQLVASKAPSQLADIPATIYSALNMNVSETEGMSVYELTESEDREIHIFAGIYTRTAKGKALVLGKNATQTTIAHVSYRAGVGWSVYKDIPGIE